MTINADMVMDIYYAQDKLQELWQTISLQHLSYLEMEETPDKLEQRNKLEEYIKEYLYLAPHNKKFLLQETAQVLHRSASTKKDFSGYRAVLGWSAIGIYAANLLAQPWRKEYRKIKMYSGFYKHQIEANLMGAEIMFEAMGYKYDRSNSILVMDGPVCPDRLINVSQDSLIAYVECQILKTIWEEVSASYKISWLEVLEFRESHLCNPKQSVLALTYRYHEKQYLQHNRSYSQGTDPFTTMGARYSPPVTNIYPTVTTNHSFPPTMHTHLPSQVLPVPSSAQYVYGSNGYFANNYPTYAPILPAQHYPCNFPITCSQSMAKPCHANNNNYCCLNGYAVGIPQDYNTQPIPTAQLVDIDPRCNTYDVPDGRPRPVSMPQTNFAQQQSLYRDSTRNSIQVNSDKEEVPPGSIESWDYVYRNLESQGYSKDLGERGDLLTSTLDTKKTKNVAKKTGLEETFSNISIKKATNKPKETEKLDNIKRETEKLKANVSAVLKVESPPRKTSISKISSSLQEALNKKSDNLKSKTLNIKKPKSKESKDREDKCDGKLTETERRTQWECSACTFLNKDGVDICEICGKSRKTIEMVMEVGGSECPQCTLVNPKNINFCKACNHSLANSPTYI